MLRHHVRLMDADQGSENPTILRNQDRNALYSAPPDISIRRKPKRSGWSNEFARTIIGQLRDVG